MATLYLCFFTFWASCFGHFSTTETLLTPSIEILGPNQFCADTLLNCGSEVSIEFEVNNANMDSIQIAAFVDLYIDGQLDFTLADSNLIHLDSTFQLAFQLEQGNHQVVIAVEDSAGNVDTAYHTVASGIDCTPPPAPVCVNGMAFELFQMGPDSTIVYYIDLRPDDLIAYSYPDDDACNSGELQYSINLLGETPAVNDSTLRLDCTDYLESSTQIIEINAWDEAGNSGSCQTFVVLFDNGFCGGNPSGISGDIYTETEEGLTGVDVMISNTQGQQVTTDQGSYAFLGATVLYDYTVQPKYNEGPLNGVSTLDMVLIGQHILGVAPLSSPYRLIAADVNGSGTITTLDLITMRKLILGHIQEFSQDVESWHFVDADYIFPNPANPWQENYPTSIDINDLPSGGVGDIDFVAIKMGDINLDADTELE